jgi:murein DD-endopeptidase MepM/ murein hydrolase activator NlpD
MRKIRRSQQIALLLKISWQICRTRRGWRLLSQAALVVVLALAIVAVWQVFGLTQIRADADNITDESLPAPATASTWVLTEDPLPLEYVAPLAGTGASAGETRQPEAFPGIPDVISSQWLFPLKVEPYTPPAGVFGSNRTKSRIHAGIDLYANSGTAVYAMTAGRVVSSGIFYQGLKNLVVENDDGTTIHYAELVPLVEVGDRVSQGQKIAILRCNFDGTCMLHLEIYASADSAPVIQDWNKDDFLYVPFASKSYERRRDLVDPSAVYSLMRP